MYLVDGSDIASEYAAVGKVVGVKGKGHHHAKTFRMGSFLIAGSTNWTTSSRCNVEVSLLVQLGTVGEAKYHKMSTLAFDRATKLTAQGILQLRPERCESPTRNKSVVKRERSTPPGK